MCKYSVGHGDTAEKDRQVLTLMKPVSWQGNGGSFRVETARRLGFVRLRESDSKTHQLSMPTLDSQCPSSSLTLRCLPFKSPADLMKMMSTQCIVPVSWRFLSFSRHRSSCAPLHGSSSLPQFPDRARHEKCFCVQGLR